MTEKTDRIDKPFFKPGDTVTFKQDLPNKPVMLVMRKEMNFFQNQNFGTQLKGIRCAWFTKDGFLQEMVVSTKDLVLVSESGEYSN